MDSGIATALAACIAAIASIVTLTVTLRATRRAEMRAAYREALQPILSELSGHMHSIVAGIVVMRKRVQRDADVSQWQAQAKQGGVALDEIRRQSGYILPEFDQPFRQLALASDHVATYKNIPDSNIEQLLAAYKALADGVNGALARSYRTGLPTGWWMRWRLRQRAAKVVDLWEQRPRRTLNPES